MRKLFVLLAVSLALSAPALASECEVFGKDHQLLGPFILKSGDAYTLCAKFSLKDVDPATGMIRISPNGQTELYDMVDLSPSNELSTARLRATPRNGSPFDVIYIDLLSVEDFSDRSYKAIAEFKTKDGIEVVSVVMSPSNP